MAGIALRRGHEVRRRFRLRILRQIASIVTGRANASGSDGMVHNRRCECCKVSMTAITLPRRRYVIRGFEPPAATGRMTI